MKRWIKKICYPILKLIKRIKIKLFNNGIYSIISRVKKIFLHKLSENIIFFDNLQKIVNNIPDSNGSNYYNKINIKIGIITDEYMFNYYKDSVDLVYISYDNYKEIVDCVDVVLFVSCWRGIKNNDWRGMSTEIGRKKVIDVFKYAHSLNKKTIFQTIEDPSNFELFLPIAKCADYIFTTDSDMIDQYKQRTKNNNVYMLDYGINPVFHNPIGFKELSIKQKNTVFFAGSWAPRYKERCEDAKILFDGTILSGKNLILADRNYFIKGYDFPNKYYKYIIPAIDHSLLQKTHKLFDWALNLNSIKYSPTMCAMRIYELQAIGNLMISNYSIAVSNKFPNIFIAKTPLEVSNILNGYSEIDIYKMQVDGIRNVMSNHTVYNKLNYIFECINEKKYISKEKAVLVVGIANKSDIKNMFEKQTYKNKSFIYLSELNNVNLNDYDYVAIFDDKINYKKYYLEDMINAFKYTNSDFITIESSIKDNKILGINHNYVNSSKKIDLVVYDRKKYNIKNLIKKGFISGKGYSIDPFQITNLKYEKCEKKELSVIIPIYNNGKYLKHRCFNSLLRSSIFDKMEIILIDDGSTDNNTKSIINELAETYSNVKTYMYYGRGSGSASRPRNKGIEISTCEYITFLDPDNEAINDGYSKLLKIVKNKKYDFVYGNIIKFSDKEITLKYFSNSREVTNPKDTLINANFKTNSIQACVIKREFILKNKIYNPIGAAGQDSFFFQEMMINANKVYYLDEPIHIYYALRDGSIVNNINRKFFEKFLIMEKYQVKKLKEYDLLEEYKEKRFKIFYKNWYLEKLKNVKNVKEKEKSKEIIKQIKKLY